MHPFDDRESWAAPVAEWRQRAMNVFTTYLGVSNLFSVTVLLTSGQFPLWQIVVGLLAYAVVLVAAVLRRQPVAVRMALLLVAHYLLIVNLVASEGIWQNLGLSLASGPIAVLVLVGVRSGLAVGGVNLALLVLAYYATQRGWILPAPRPWGENAWLVPSVRLLLDSVPRILLLAWFARFLVDAVRRERQTGVALLETAARLEREAGERRRLQLEVLQAGERERRAIGRDLHDGTCQELTGAILYAKGLQRALARRGEPESAAAQTLVEDLGRLVDDVRGLSRRLSPGWLESTDLPSALEDLVRKVRGTVELAVHFRHVGAAAETSGEVALHLYRIAQEALTNAVRHAGATRIDVELSCDPQTTILHVVDDGRGLPAGGNGDSRGLGLRSMSWRANLLGGTLEVAARPGGGTRVECRVPGAAADTENRA